MDGNGRDRNSIGDDIVPCTNCIQCPKYYLLSLQLKMAIKKFNICVRKTYKKGEEEKAFWPNVGSLTIFPAFQDKKEGFKIELNMYPDTQFYVFEAVERGEIKKKEPVIEYPEEEINPEDVPF